jgi:hypothetical protein
MQLNPERDIMKKILSGILLMVTLTTSAGPRAGQMCYWGVKCAASSVMLAGFLKIAPICIDLTTTREGENNFLMPMASLGAILGAVAWDRLEAAASAARDAGIRMSVPLFLNKLKQ